MILRLLTTLLLSTILIHAKDLSITQKSTGKSITVKPVAVKNGKFTGKKGRSSFTVPLSSLTIDSQKRIKQWLADSIKSASENNKAINEAIGHNLFHGATPLWEQDITAVAKRLRWKPESLNGPKSFRLYPRPSYGFLNAHPFCCSLYAGEDDKAGSISLVYANKGDYGSNVGFGQNHFKPQGNLPSAKNLNGAIQRDAKAISLALTKALGEPEEQKFGEKHESRDVLRWDFGEHAFILSEEKDEYTHLLITTTELADDHGKHRFIADHALRKELEENVTTKGNGDTYIANLPMVDQGPKGYCAPATFERAMRYMKIPADMYLLATLATEQGGGTRTSLLAEHAKRSIHAKNRRIRELNLKEDLDLKLVKKYIDKGIPILWQMRSLDVYNNVANKRTVQRKSMQDTKQWAADIQAEATRLASSLRSESNHHICMIIGYNEKTKELAVSDSWGPSYEIRWVHIDIAKAVSSRGGFVINL